MAVTVARDTIVCPLCGSRRVVTLRQRRRAFSRDEGIPCATCRGVADTKPFSEGDLSFWLLRFGVRVPDGTDARSFVLAGGAPPELVELAKQAFPEMR